MFLAIAPPVQIFSSRMPQEESPSRICFLANGKEVWISVPQDKPLLLEIKQHVKDTLTGLTRIRSYVLCAKAAGGMHIR